MSITKTIQRKRIQNFYDNHERYFHLIMMESILRRIPLVYVKGKYVCESEKKFNFLAQHVVAQEEQLTKKFADMDTSDNVYCFNMNADGKVIVFQRFIKDRSWHEKVDAYTKAEYEYGMSRIKSMLDDSEK